MRPSMIAVSVLSLSFAAPAAGAQQRLATHLITHSSVEIDAGAAAIWPRIVDPSGWKQGARLVHTSGPTGEVGEVFAAVAPSSPTEPAYFVQNVELVPNQRRTIKLYGRDGTLIGFASFSLEERGRQTIVRYDVYAESLLPPDSATRMTAEATAQAEQKTRETESKRFDAELVALKRLVEKERARRR